MQLLNLLLLASLVIASPLFGFGQSAKEFTISSKSDYFKITKKGSSYYIGKKKINLDPLKDYLPLFGTDLIDECPTLPKKADVSIISKRNNKKVRRKFYMNARIMSDGTNCAEVDGDGIYFIPQSRAWFNEDTRSTIDLKKRFILNLANNETISFQKRGTKWYSQDPQFFPHWNFFAQFLDSVKNYSIDARVHTSVTESAMAADWVDSNFTLRVSGKKYKFYRLGEKLWVVKLPKIKWLLSSNRWTFFADMDVMMWRDPNTPFLRAVSDKNIKIEDRKAAVKKIGITWNRNVKSAFHNVLLSDTDNNAFKSYIAAHLRKHPSDENILVVVQALSKTEDPELLNQYTQILRIRNPKGPLINPEVDAGEQQQQIREWQKWAKKLKVK